MCGGVVPQYASTETETWSCLSVPPPALHAERPRWEGTSGPGLGLLRCVSSIRLSNPLHKGMSADLDEVCEVPLLFGMLPPQGSGRGMICQSS